MESLRYIPPNELSVWWEEVKPGLEIVKKRSGNWLCEDIYTAIKTGVSTLHLVSHGFVVLTPLTNLSGKSLEITAAYSSGGVDIFNYLPELERMARAIGARELVFSSKRNWGKFFTPKCTVYSKEV